MTFKATRGIEFTRALADALGLEGVRHIEIIGGIEEPLVVRVEMLVDAADEPALVDAVEANANNDEFRESCGRMR